MAKLDDKKLVNQILINLKARGDLTHAGIGLNISYHTIERACNSKSKYFRPKFAKQVKEALAEYAATHIPPHEQAYLKKGVLEQYADIIKSGITQTEEEDYEYFGDLESYSGKLQKKQKHIHGLPRWVYEKAFPPLNPTQEGLLYYSERRFNHIKESTKFTPAEKEKLLIDLREFAKEEAINLQLSGKPTTLLEELTDEPDIPT